MCDDIEAFVGQMKARQIDCGPVTNRGWGLRPSSHCRWRIWRLISRGTPGRP